VASQEKENLACGRERVPDATRKVNWLITGRIAGRERDTGANERNRGEERDRGGTRNNAQQKASADSGGRRSIRKPTRKG